MVGLHKDGFMRYRASKQDCDAFELKPRCCPGRPARKIPCSIYKEAREMARHCQDRRLSRLAPTEKKIETLLAHLKRILKLDRLRLRGPKGARDEFLMAAAAYTYKQRA